MPYHPSRSKLPQLHRRSAVGAMLGLVISLLPSTSAIADDSYRGLIGFFDPALEMAIQNELARQGFYRGRIDERTGTGAQQAIRRFRRARGIVRASAGYGYDPNLELDGALVRELFGFDFQDVRSLRDELLLIRRLGLRPVATHRQLIFDHYLDSERPN